MRGGAGGFIFSIDGRMDVQDPFRVGFQPPASPESILSEEPVRRLLTGRAPLSTPVAKFLGVAGGDLLLAPMMSGDSVVGAIGVGGKEERGSGSGRCSMRPLSVVWSPRRETPYGLQVYVGYMYTTEVL